VSTDSENLWCHDVHVLTLINRMEVEVVNLLIYATRTEGLPAIVRFMDLLILCRKGMRGYCAYCEDLCRIVCGLLRVIENCENCEFSARSELDKKCDFLDHKNGNLESEDIV
jgi:hypothetical protein